MVNQKVCKKKYLSRVYGVDRKNLSLGITVRHHSASLVMPISDPRDRFFYPHHTPMKDTHYIQYGKGISINHKPPCVVASGDHCPPAVTSGKGKNVT